MEKLTIVGWLWHQKECRSHYTPEHANIWVAMLERHLTIPHRFVLLTDHPAAIQNPKSKIQNPFDPRIELIPLWNDWRDLKRLSTGRFNPFCYTRLKAFSAEFADILHGALGESDNPKSKIENPKFVSIDLDVLPLANLDSLFTHDDDFRIIRRVPRKGHEKLGTYQASMWMMNAGAREKVWKEFKGHESIVAAARFLGSDQAWLNHILGDEKGWDQGDGVYGFIDDLYRTQKYKEAPPANARLVTFNGTIKPWEFIAGRRHDYQWVAKHYRAEDPAIQNPKSKIQNRMVDISPAETGAVAGAA